MPLTPATWLNDFVVNLTTTGTQSNPRITQLANGIILVVWDSADNSGVGAPIGIDVIGQLFSPLGERLGAEFLVNSAIDNDEGNADAAALPAGGFLTVFEVADTGGGKSISLTERDTDGGNPVSVNIATSDALGNNFSLPRIVVSNDSSALVTYTLTDGAGFTKILGRIYDANTNTLGSEITLINLTGGNSDAEAAVLSDGNYVIAAVTAGSGTSLALGISIRIVSPTGSNVLAGTLIASTVDGINIEDIDPSVTALSTGGFVVTWTNNTSGVLQVFAQRFLANGTLDGAQITVEAGTDDIDESSVVALPDGGFIVFYDNESAANIQAQRYDSVGNTAGGQVTIASGGAAGDIDAELLDDGRVAVSFQDANGEIRMTILDTRDAANSIGVYSPQDWQIGTIGDDVITSDGDVYFVAGWDGNDTINTGGFFATYMGGNGNDRINAIGLIDVADIWDGGTDTDTIDFSGAVSLGGAFDLTAGTATILGATHAMTAFENLTGTAVDDMIKSSNVANNLNGGGGADLVDYSASNAAVIVDLNSGTALGGHANGDVLSSIERLIGSAFADTLIGNASANVLSGGNAGDVLSGGDDADVLDGDAGEDILIGGNGADQLNGGADIDVLVGGDGSDTYTADLISDVISETNAVLATGGNDLVIFTGTSGTFTLGANLERLALGGGAAINGTGNALANTITGNGTANTLNGLGGVDIMDGGNGSDIYFADVFNDAIAESNTVLAIGGNDLVNFTGTSGTFTLGLNIERLTLGGVVAINGTGNALANTITGNAAANSINGSSGIDTMIGGNGTDTYFADLTTDIISETNAVLATGGNDIVYFVGTSGTFTLSANVERLTLSGVSAINGTGNTLANSIIGNGASNVINGMLGNDILTGGLGSDFFVFNTLPNALTNRDTITDYNVAADTIRLENTGVFTALGLATGVLNVALFKNLSLDVADTTDRILYNDTTGAVFYDIDGSGASAAVQFATITGAPTLTNLDFVVI